MRNEADISGKLDWATMALYAALVALGWINIYAAVYDETANQTIWDLSLNSGRQLMFIVASLVIILMIIIVDMRFYETFAYLFYGIILFVLLLVPVIGKEVGGNKSWIGIGSFGVQPSEFAKFVTALAVAKFMGSVGFRMDNNRNQMILFGMIFLPLALILLQKDFGTAIVFTAFVFVFYREGMSPFIIIVGVSAAAIAILTLIVKNQWYLHGAILIVLAALIFFGKRKA